MMSAASSLQPWQIGDLPLAKLLAAGRRVERGNQKAVRVAVLGDAATQHYCMALSAAFKLRGWWPEIYEAEYDTIRQEVLDPASGLYAHNPQFVIIFATAQALVHRHHSETDKSQLADIVGDEWQQIRDEIKARTSATVVQHNLVVPLDRPFGNNSVAFPGTLAGTVTKLNAMLAEAAERKELLLVDTEFRAAYHGKRNWLDERLWCQAKQALSPAFLPDLAKAVSDVILAQQGEITKCLVLDLDNTLWGGILADEGPHGLEMGQTELGLAYLRFQLSLLQLKERGLVLAVCSKNNETDVLEVLDNHPDMVLRRSDFAAIVANFGDKVSNLMEIKERLNIGYDSMVFLDDTPFERDIVRTALPQVQVPELPEDPANFVSELARWNLFEGQAATAEDLARNDFYQANEARRQIRSSFAGLDDYINNLEMKAELSPLDSYVLPRAFQLVQRSNQFNLTTIRYSEDDLKEIAADGESRAFSVRLSDRLGDNGIIAFVIVKKRGTDALVDTWIMSCRVLGRRVEDLTVQAIVDRAAELGCDRVIGRYVPTSKNGMVAKLYPDQGFELVRDEGGELTFALDLKAFKTKSIPIVVEQKVAGHV